MSRKWGIVLLVLLASLLFASPNIRAAEGANNIDPKIQLEIERRVNERSLEDYKKIDDRFGDYKWFGMFIIALLAAGGFAVINNTVAQRVDSKMKEELEKLKPGEQIQKKVDELDKEIKSTIEYVSKSRQQAEKKIEEATKIAQTAEPMKITSEQKEIVKEAAEEIKKKPEEEYSAEDYFLLGLQAAENGQFEDAIKYNQKAIQLKPDYPFAYYNLGWTYNKLGKYDQGIEAYQKTIQLNPDYSEAHNNLGATYGKIGKYDQAIEACKKALQINPDCLLAYETLACTYSLKEDKDEALKYMELAIDNGYDDLKHIEENSDLDFIRDTAEYKRIIKKLKDKLQR